MLASLAGSLALVLAGLGLGQDPTPAGEPRTAAQCVAELEAGSFAEAKRGLLALGAREALPALVQAIAELPPSAAWQAVRVLRGFPAQDAADRLACREGAKQLGKLAVGAPQPERRHIAAFALGALGEQASATAKDLARRLEDEESEAVRLGCALALADMGADARKPLLKLLESERVTPKVLTLAALAIQGTDKGGVARSVEGVVLRVESFHAFLAGGAALFALERCAGTAAAANAASRQRELARGRTWGGGGGKLNWGGIVPNEPAEYVGFWTHTLGLPKPKPREYALPQAFDPPLGSWFSLAEGYRQLLTHLARELEPIHERLDSDAYPSLTGFAGETRPLLNLAALLRAVERLVAPEAKR